MIQIKDKKSEPQVVDLGETPLERGEFSPPNGSPDGASPEQQQPSGGGSFFSLLLWFGAAFLGIKGLINLVGSITSLSDPSVSGWASMGIVMGLGMLMGAGVLALFASLAGRK